VVVCILLLTGPTWAVTYDLYTDWSNTANPNGPWAYWEGTTLLPHQSGSPDLPGNFFAPGPASPNFLPAWLKVTDVTIFTPNLNGIGIYTHSYDPGNGGDYHGESKLTWTSQSPGIISISGMLWYGFPKTITRSNDFSLYLGGTLLDTGTVSYLNYVDKDHARLLSNTGLTVNAGDVVSLVIKRTSEEVSGTFTAMSFTITESAVPLPGAVLLLGSGFLRLACYMRRKKS